MRLGYRLGQPRQRRWKGSRIRREIIDSIEMGKVPSWMKDIPWSKIRMEKGIFQKPRVMEWSEVEAKYKSREDKSKC